MCCDEKVRLRVGNQTNLYLSEGEREGDFCLCLRPDPPLGLDLSHTEPQGWDGLDRAGGLCWVGMQGVAGVGSQWDGAGRSEDL